MSRILTLCLFIIFHCILYGQENIYFQLKDSHTGDVVPYAFVFIDNTSIGTNTDENGTATLNPKNQTDFTVVITHILYEKVEIKSSELQKGINRINLREKVLTLEEVTIKTKKSNPRKRKRWIKRFEKAFIGEKISSKRVSLLNPEVLWFEETDTALHVHAVDNLKLLNKDLGYQVQIVMDDFTLSNQGDTKFSTKLFFEDIADQSNKNQRIMATREKNYLQSRRLFFKSLIHRHPSNEKFFRVGITTSRNDSLKFEAIDPDNLYWSYGPKADTLIMTDYLTVINKFVNFKSFVAKGNQGKAYKKTPATTFLKSKTGKFIISHEGYLINQKDIEESGYWTAFRMAMELPRDYDGGIIFNDKSQRLVVERLLKYGTNQYPEKVYIHTNKSSFTPYETLWMKGYLVDAIDHRPSQKSKVVYIDLISPKGDVIQNWILNTDKGLKADYQWTPRSSTGIYTLRAYTNNMRNQGEDFFFEKSISLEELTYVKEESIIEPNDSLVVEFYPEGGDLIRGVTSQIAFHAVNAEGYPIELTGVVEDSEGKVLADIESSHKGIGLFSITPKAAAQYYLITQHQGMEYRFPLPEVSHSGITLSINNNNANEVFVTVNASMDTLLKGAFLIGHIRGDIKIYETNLLENRSLKLPKSSLPNGLVHLTLFDDKDRPHAERVFFNDHGYDSEIISSQLDNMHNDDSNKSSLIILLDSTYSEQILDLSASINNSYFYSSQSGNIDIQNYLLLQSDISRMVPDINYYLSDISKTKRYLLDLILRCHAWSRFNWKDFRSDTTILDFPIENGLTIKGRALKKDDTSGTQAQIILNSLDEQLIFDEYQTDESGHFVFRDLNFTDSTLFVLQGRKNNGQSESEEDVTSPKGNRLLDLELNRFYPTVDSNQITPFYRNRKGQDYSEGQIATLKENYQISLEQDTNVWTLEIDEVQIQSTRPSRTNRNIGTGKYFNLDYVDWVTPELSGTRLLTKLAPSRSYYVGDEGKLYSIVVNRKGEIVYVPMQIVIDGMGAEKGGSNALPLYNISADQIQTIYVGKTFVNITTRDIPRSRERYLESGILNFVHPGFYRARQFSPYSLSQARNNISNSILWEPDFKLNEEGQGSLEFIPNPFIDQYSLKIEGITESGKIINHLYQFKIPIDVMRPELD